MPLLKLSIRHVEVPVKAEPFIFFIFLVLPMRDKKAITVFQNAIERQCGSTFYIDVNATAFINDEIPEQISACSAVGRINAIVLLEDFIVVILPYKVGDVLVFVESVFPRRIHRLQLGNIFLNFVGQLWSRKSLVDNLWDCISGHHVR